MQVYFPDLNRQGEIISRDTAACPHGEGWVLVQWPNGFNSWVLETALVPVNTE